MTRNRVPYRGLGLVAAAVATVMSPNVFSQASTASLLNAPAGVQSCAYSSISTLANGQVQITCNPTTPGVVGTVGFSATSYPAVSKDAAANATFSVPVHRNLGATGAVDGTVSVNATSAAVCNIAAGAGAVHFNDGDSTPKTISVTGTALGFCNLSFTLASGSTATPGFIATAVEVRNAATLPPPVAGCEGKTPTSNYQLHTSLGNPGQTLLHTGSMGVVHSWPLPKNTAGLQVPSGLLSHTMWMASTSPMELTLEWSFSKCPGDFAYSRTTEASVLSSRGKAYYPCYGSFGVESGGVKWSTTGATDYCKVPSTTESWYVNLRYTSGCPTGNCMIVYSWF